MTLIAICDLTVTTKGKGNAARQAMARRWQQRYNNSGTGQGIGKGWPIKQQRLTADIKWLIAQLETGKRELLNDPAVAEDQTQEEMDADIAKSSKRKRSSAIASHEENDLSAGGGMRAKRRKSARFSTARGNGEEEDDALVDALVVQITGNTQAKVRKEL